MSDAVLVYERLPFFAQREVDDFIYFVSERVSKKTKKDSDIAERLEILESLQKFRGRLTADFDAEKELEDARAEKYGL